MAERAADLERLQRWLQTVVMHPGGAARGVAARAARAIVPQERLDPASLVRFSAQLDALERLGVYANMYYWRLLDILREEYPGTRHLLGEHVFERAGRAFIDRHPSRHHSLSCFSTEFPAFLGRHLRGDPRRLFAVDLARVERAMEDVFDERQVEVLRFETLAAMPVEAWAHAVLELNPALRLLRLAHPVNPYMNALRSSGRPRRPRLRTSWLAVYRHRYRVWRVDLSAAQYRLLGALADGVALGHAVALGLARARREGGPQPDLATWFRDWTAQGLFCGLRTDAACTVNSEQPHEREIQLAR